MSVENNAANNIAGQASHGGLKLLGGAAFLSSLFGANKGNSNEPSAQHWRNMDEFANREHERAKDLAAHNAAIGMVQTSHEHKETRKTTAASGAQDRMGMRTKGSQDRLTHTTKATQERNTMREQSRQFKSIGDYARKNAADGTGISKLSVGNANLAMGNLPKAPAAPKAPKA